MGKKHEEHPLLERQVIDRDPVKVHLSGGVNKVRVPKRFKIMHLLKTFFEKDLEMQVVMEDGVPHLEIRRVEA